MIPSASIAVNIDGDQCAFVTRRSPSRHRSERPLEAVQVRTSGE
jgi:hypothetical protein